MKNKITALALIAVIAGVFAFRAINAPPPSDLRDAVGDDVKSQDFDTTIPVIEEDNGNIPVPKARNVSPAGEPANQIDWVTINGGKFMMGTDSDSDPQLREVTIKTFEMSRTEVTMAQYEECVNKRRCQKPGTGNVCNWGRPGLQQHPVNCVNWKHVHQYAKFKKARLPSESEWEYAATSEGMDREYPWGNEHPTCDVAVIMGTGTYVSLFAGFGCGSGGTMPVCSKPKGNTVQGLCDMAGNVCEWVTDKRDYSTVPKRYRMLRGGCFYDEYTVLRIKRRGYSVPGYLGGSMGFRLARSIR